MYGIFSFSFFHFLLRSVLVPSEQRGISTFSHNEILAGAFLTPSKIGLSSGFQTLRCVSGNSFSRKNGVSWLRPMGTGQVIQRLQILESTAVEQLDRALLKFQNGIALRWTRQMTSIGQELDTRVLGKVDKWNGSRKAWPNWSFVIKSEQRAAWIASKMLYVGGVRRRLFFQAYSPKKDARLVVMMLVLPVLLDTNDVVAEPGDAMNTNAILKSPLEGASGVLEGAGTQRSCAGTARERTSECRKMQRRMVDNKRRSKRRLKCKCHECGQFGLGMNSREASVFEASERGLADRSREIARFRMESTRVLR